MRISTAFYLCAAATCANTLISMGFTVAILLAPHADDTAMYLAARCLPLLAVALWLTARRSYAGIAAMAPLVALIQACDAVIGVIERDPSKTIGPAIIALVTALAAMNLCRQLKGTARE